MRYEIKKMSEIKTWVYMQITLFKKWMHLSANKKSNIIWQNRYEKIFGLSAKELYIKSFGLPILSVYTE